MIRLIVLDVDGVLTDGKIYYCGNFDCRAFNVKDGFAIKRAMHKGIEFAVISGRQSRVVERRCRELGIRFIFQGIDDKVAAYEEIAKTLDIGEEESAFMGDDIPDIPLLLKVGFSGAPQDAAEEVKKIVDFVSSKKGGDGAVREFIEKILGEGWFEL